MGITLVEVTRHDEGWKGTWYKTGQRHFVQKDPDWPKVMACKWRALDISGGIHEADCRVVRGPIAWIRCRMRALRPNAELSGGGTPSA